MSNYYLKTERALKVNDHNFWVLNSDCDYAIVLANFPTIRHGAEGECLPEFTSKMLGVPTLSET
jgi:hypothetical protein